MKKKKKTQSGGKERRHIRYRFTTPSLNGFIDQWLISPALSAMSPA